MSDTEEQPSKIRRVCREKENVTNEADDTTINDSETTVKESNETVIKVSKSPEAGAVLTCLFFTFFINHWVANMKEAVTMEDYSFQSLSLLH